MRKFRFRGLTLLVAFPGAVLAQDGPRPVVLPHGAEAADFLPDDGAAHPLGAKIAAFLKAQDSAADSTPDSVGGFRPTGLSGADYLNVIDGEVAALKKYQASSGIIVDPVEKQEWQYATPCYALAVAVLAATGKNADPVLLESGLKAMDAAIEEMHEYRCANNHGDFFMYPVILAMDLYAKPVPGRAGGAAPPAQMAAWRKKLSEIDPYRLYKDALQDARKDCHNWNVVALCGEYLRHARGLATAEFVEKHLDYQTRHFTPLGMYRDPSCPMPYDHFPRHFLAGILYQGYRGASFETYRDLIWKGAWTSLFMQSPSGELPTGHRSSQHIWNEAEQAVTYEIFAAEYTRRGKAAEAGAFKRAARLSLACVKRWIRPDGSGYIVKNRYPIEARYAYEGYSSHTQYNMLACAMMAAAYVYADESVMEAPCPADVGGFVVPILDDFHKIFANAGGTYVEIDTDGDHVYNPTGILRVHVKGGNPQLGPSDGAVPWTDHKTKEDLGGEFLCVGPGWADAKGARHKLADYKPPAPPKVEVLEETPARVRFRVVTEGVFDGVTRVTETMTVEPEGVTVEDALESKDLQEMRVYYPMLVFDGLDETKVEMEKSAVRLTLRDGSSRFALLEPAGVELKRTGKRTYHKNGQIEAAYADVPGTRAVYRITAR